MKKAPNSFIDGHILPRYAMMPYSKIKAKWNRIGKSSCLHSVVVSGKNPKNQKKKNNFAIENVNGTIVRTQSFTLMSEIVISKVKKNCRLKTMPEVEKKWMRKMKQSAVSILVVLPSIQRKSEFFL